MLEIPSFQKVSVHFRMKGKPPALYRYPGVGLVEPTEEQSAARAKYAEENRGELIFPGRNEKSGLMSGTSPDAFVQPPLVLVRATVEERWMEATEWRDASPYLWFTFTFVKSAFPKTQVLGADAKRAFAERFQSAWSDVRVYRNPIVKDGVPLDESALDIVFAAPATMPAKYELGDELVFGIRSVKNIGKNKDRLDKNEACTA